MPKPHQWRVITAFGTEEVLLEFYKLGRPSIWVQIRPDTPFGAIVLKHIAIACQRPLARTGEDFIGAKAEYMPVPGRIMAPYQVETRLLLLRPGWYDDDSDGQETLWRRLVQLEDMPDANDTHFEFGVVGASV